MFSVHMGWFGHQVASAAIHGAVYGVIYHLFKGLGLVGSILTALAILAAVYFFTRRD